MNSTSRPNAFPDSGTPPHNPGAQGPDPTDEPWRRRARLTVLLSAASGIVLLVIAAVLAWSWRADLPDPVASHWGTGGSPDGFSSQGSLLATTSLVGLGCVVLFSAIGLFSGRAASTLRITAASTVWICGLLAILIAGSLAGQRGLTDAHQARGMDGVLLLALLAPLVPAVLAALLIPADRRQPATGAVPASAPRVSLGASTRAVWLRRTSGGPGLLVSIAGVLVIVVASIITRMPVLLALAALLALLFATMFAFRVTVDSAGIEIRSALGWPRTRIGAAEVERAEAIHVSPFRDFGGWGWRVNHSGRTGIVLRSGPGLLVEQSGGWSLVVTIEDAEEGAALLNTMAARART